MRAVSRLLGVAVIGAVVAGSAQAQTCNGLSSLKTHKMNIGANAWFADGATSFGGQFNTALSSLFLGVGAGITTYDADGSDNTTNINANLGWEKESGKFAICPQAVFGYDKTGDFDAVKDIGGKVGLAYDLGGSSMKLIPFGSLGIFKTLDCDGCDNTMIFGAGLGIRFNNGMQISPQFEKSDVDGSKAVFGATVSFPFGKK